MSRSLSVPMLNMVEFSVLTTFSLIKTFFCWISINFSSIESSQTSLYTLTVFVKGETIKVVR